MHGIFGSKVVKSVAEIILANDSHSKSKFKRPKNNKILKVTWKRKGGGILNFPKYSTRFFGFKLI